eukprot:scaffold7349_cov383-Pinguiococcus_pyrenoidosus.AAC.6
MSMAGVRGRSRKHACLTMAKPEDVGLMPFPTSATVDGPEILAKSSIRQEVQQEGQESEPGELDAPDQPEMSCASAAEKLRGSCAS